MKTERQKAIEQAIEQIKQAETILKELCKESETDYSELLDHEGMTFGSKLRQIRKDYGITTEQLSKLTKIPVRTIENWEYRKSEPEYIDTLVGATLYGNALILKNYISGYSIQIESEDKAEVGVWLKCKNMAEYNDYLNKHIIAGDDAGIAVEITKCQRKHGCTCDRCAEICPYSRTGKEG